MMLPFLVFLLASIISGIVNPIAIRHVSTDFNPLVGSFIRFFGATVVLLPFWLKKKEMVRAKDVIKFIPFGLNGALFSFAILHTSVIMSNILYSFVPLWTAFLGYFILKEKLSKNHIWGLLLSILGIGVLLKGSIETSDILTFGEPIGNILVMLGVFFWGFWLMGARDLSKRYSALTILFFTFLVSTILTFVLVLGQLILAPFHILHITYQGTISLIAVILLSSIALYFLYQWLIKHTSAFIASLIQYGSLLFGAIGGVVVFHERLTVEIIIGAFLIMIGVFLATTYTQLKKR